MSLKTLAWCCLALAPGGVFGGACKPRSTDITTTSTVLMMFSSETSQPTDPTTTTSADVETTVSSDVPVRTTSSEPCPSWTPITPYPANKVCGKEVYRGNLDSSPVYLGNQLKENINACAKVCGDTKDCVSFYAQDYVPGPGAPTYKICFLFKGYEEDIEFAPGDKPSYWEQGCFECTREVADPIQT